MADIRIALRHRRRRLAVMLRHITSLSGRRSTTPASRQSRQDRYLRSRLFTLNRRAPRYDLIHIRRLDLELGAGDRPAPTANDASQDAVWELRLRGPRGVRHRVGDTVLVRWCNDPNRVAAVHDALAAPKSDGRPHLMVGYSSVFQPGRLQLLSLRRILEEELELYTAAPELQRRVATVGNSPLDQLSPGDAGGGRGIDLLTVLRSAAPEVTPRELIRYQGRNGARAYSVSRIVPHDRYDEIEIIVSAVQTHLKQAEGPIVSMEGRATAWFRRLAEVDLSRDRAAGESAADPVSVQAWRLRHPWRLDVVGTRPMVIVVAGTGIAGVMAWLRDDAPKGPVWLIYGVRDWQTRGLYQEELTRLVHDGTLIRLDVAESRSPAADSFQSGDDGAEGDGESPAEFHLHRRMRVHHVIESQDETLRAMIAGGAGIYISGPRPMGEAARQSIMWALGEDSSPDLLERWDAEGRLQVSVS